MKRLSFTPDADHDLEYVSRYLQTLSSASAMRIGRSLQQAFQNITRFPGFGRVDEKYSRLFGKQIHRLVSGRYLIFY